MTRSATVYGCTACAAERVNVSGIESHIMHKHPDLWRRVLADFTIQPYIRIVHEETP